MTGESREVTPSPERSRQTEWTAPSVVCSNCGAVDDDAVDMDWTLGYKKGVVINATCDECGGELLAPRMIPGVLFVLDEYEASMWWDVRERMLSG